MSNLFGGTLTLWRYHKNARALASLDPWHLPRPYSFHPRPSLNSLFGLIAVTSAILLFSGAALLALGTGTSYERPSFFRP